MKGIFVSFENYQELYEKLWAESNKALVKPQTLIRQLIDKHINPPEM